MAAKDKWRIQNDSHSWILYCVTLRLCSLPLASLNCREAVKRHSSILQISLTGKTI